VPVSVPRASGLGHCPVGPRYPASAWVRLGHCLVGPGILRPLCPPIQEVTILQTSRVRANSQ
jgi:hypothetical protein